MCSKKLASLSLLEVIVNEQLVELILHVGMCVLWLCHLILIEIKSLTMLPSPDLEVKYIGGIDPRMLILENGEEKEVCTYNWLIITAVP